jgi:hypothetical protein
MWWAVRAAKRGRAIQDRWCADCIRGGQRLIIEPTQMAIPLQMEMIS